MKNYNLIFLITLIFISFITIIYVLNFHNSKINNKFSISNSLILVWDLHCKSALIDYLNRNNISYTIIDIKNQTALILKVNKNYFCLMKDHPQEYSNISILIDSIDEIIKNLGSTSLIGLSTAGSLLYKIGDVLQFNSAFIQNYQKYSLNNNFIKAKNILYKTSKFTNEIIDDTKGFIEPNNNFKSDGQDEFIVYFLSNEKNIPCLTLTGISDQNNKYEYNNGGGEIAAKNVISFLFNSFNLL
uniref:Uncharacterized protein n=1 Tax=viral metagenome TaxID=1070528 RepID=A0A6C0KRF1_9ZZZZ